MSRARWLGLVLAGLALCAGCARHYNITLNNNHVIGTSSKPRLNKTGDAYEFKDGAGKPSSVPAGRVKLIEPRSSSPTEETIQRPSR